MLQSQTVQNWPEWKCPADQKPLVEDGNKLRCEAGHSYAIVKGIPRFVGSSSYADHFGAQWNQYRLTQLDSYTGKPITRDRLRRCLGEELWSTLSTKTILELGCGAGRFTEVLLGQGARVASIDLSSAVEANAQSFPIGERHRIAQANLLNLPFAPNQFEIVMCLGVVQHTPSPEKTIEALRSHLAPGGTLVIDHYTNGFAWYTKTAPIFRAVLTRLPVSTAMSITERLVKGLLPLHKAAVGNRIGTLLLYRFSPVMCYYSMFPELDDRLQFEWALLDTHDSLTDWYKHFRNREQIRATLEKLGLRNIWCEYGGNGVEARATA